MSQNSIFPLKSPLNQKLRWWLYHCLIFKQLMAIYGVGNINTSMNHDLTHPNWLKTQSVGNKNLENYQKIYHANFKWNPRSNQNRKQREQQLGGLSAPSYLKYNMKLNVHTFCGLAVHQIWRQRKCISSHLS